MLSKILLIMFSVSCLVIGILAFILNHKEKKNEQMQKENELLQEELKKANESVNAADKASSKYVEEKKENEELLEKSAINNLSGLNAGIDLLQKLSKGR